MKSLKTTIYIQILLLIILVNLITGVIFFISSVREINKHLMDEASQISKRTAKSLAFPFWNLDSIGVNEILDAQMQSSNMYAIKISELSNNQHFIKGFKKDKDGKILPILNDEKVNSQFSVKTPINFENELLGHVTVTLSDKVLRSLLIKNQLNNNLVELIILLLLAIPVTFFITSSFIRPLIKLTENFSTVISTGFETAVSSAKSREIDNIAQIFEKVRLTILKTFLEIRKNEKYLNITLNSISDGIIATDYTGNIRRLNPIAEKLTGIKSENAIGKKLESVLKIVTIDKDDIKNDIINEIKISKDPISTHVLLANNNDDKKSTIDILSSHIIDEENKDNGIVVVLRDITEQLRIEEELNQSRKMESLGQLSGGVAHDFNNMLGAIIGFSEQIMDNSDPKSTEHKYSSNILKAANNAADLTAKLLAFSRKGKIVSTPFSIHSSCNTVISLLSRTINKNISIIKEFNAEQEFISGDPSQIQNAILNICINAKDALPNGGDLILTSENITITEPNNYNLKSDKYLKLMISDTGIGIPEDIKKRIFEPFFTTKEIGKGTGLGLAAVYGSIKNHHGEIFVESSEGKGTTFTIFLPVVENETKEITKTEKDENKVFDKCALVVDDEKLIRAMLDATITGMGGEIIQVADGIEAIALFKEKHMDIDVVFLDMVMPKMNGDVCFYELQKINKNIPIIVTSGFDKNEAISQLLHDGAAGYLHKPFNVRELRKLLLSI